MVPVTRHSGLHFLTEGEVKRVLASISQIPKHQYGQNFLVARPTIERIIDSCGIHAGEAFLEIGPGLGALTFNIAMKGAKVLAVELNDAFAGYLRSKAIELSLHAVEIINADALDIEFPRGLHVITSMPYSIAGPLTFKILRYLQESSESSPATPLTAHVICQKEFARKLIARPGTRDYSRISAVTAFLAGATVEFDISRGSFYPVPKVDSSLVKLVPRMPPAGVDPGLFLDLVTGIFPYKNKLVQKALGFFVKRAIPSASSSSIMQDMPFAMSRVRDLDLQSLEALSCWWAERKASLASRGAGC